ncbi:Glycosyl transferases group 1 [Lachnospiraceae bacterium]|nr:Glycosyl transferases group 1 [Lachnospiraceae bacterium]
MKIVLFKNTVESQEFFSFVLAEAFREMGHEVFIYDCGDPLVSFRYLVEFIEMGNTVIFAFNFNGMINDPCLCEDRDPVFLKKTGLPYFNMVVDHPFYYHEEFAHVPPNYVQLCIDKNHIRYMKRFFPHIDADHYMELAGTQLRGSSEKKQWELTADDLIPYEKRRDDIIFTGNYILPESYEKYLEPLEQPVADFYHRIFRELRENPSKTLEDHLELRIREEFGDKVTDDYLRQCFANMIMLDLQIRHYFRGQAVSAIADAGYRITVYGAGYEDLPCRHKENIINKGNVNSRKCLEAIAQSRVSLNVMPWFKDGPHDRVFNTMLNGAISLSDHSRALDEYFTDRDDIVFYDLQKIDHIVEDYAWIMDHPAEARDLALKGYEEAKKAHTWKHRALELEKMFKTALAK